MDRRDQRDQETSSQNDRDEELRRPTPLPKLQLFIVYLIQFSEPIAGLVIYPFVNQFVQRTGITGGDETKTGYYAGVIESLFFLAECATVIQWGILSDRFGRRPILLIGPLGLSFAMIAFGLSTRYWGLAVSRTAQGAFNGNIGVSKSVIAELTDSTNIADAYSYMAFVWSFGVTLGPIIGGVLAEPADRWPDTIGKIAVFRDHPYFLPCLVAGIIAFATYVFSSIYLKESLPHLVAGSSSKPSRISLEEGSSLLHDSDTRTYGAAAPPQHADSVEGTETTQAPVPLRSIFTFPFFAVVANYGFAVFLDMGNSVLLPLVLSTPVKYGGLGLDAFHIGTLLGSLGFINSVVQARFVGPTVRRFGARRVFRVGLTSFVIPFAFFPLERHLASKAGYADSAVYTLLILHLASSVFLYGAYASYHVLLVGTVTKGGQLATANGFGQMVSSGLRTLAPTLASSLFSVSIRKQLLGGNLVFYIFIGLTLCGSAVSGLLPDV